jgi:hypothetical protein
LLDNVVELLFEAELLPFLEPPSFTERGLVKKFSILRFKFLNKRFAAASESESSLRLSRSSLALFSK